MAENLQQSHPALSLPPSAPPVNPTGPSETSSPTPWGGPRPAVSPRCSLAGWRWGVGGCPPGGMPLPFYPVQARWCCAAGWWHCEWGWWGPPWHSGGPHRRKAFGVVAPRRSLCPGLGADPALGGHALGPAGTACWAPSLWPSAAGSWCDHGRAKRQVTACPAVARAFSCCTTSCQAARSLRATEPVLSAWRSPAEPFPPRTQETPFSTGLGHSCKPRSLPSVRVSRGHHLQSCCDMKSLQSSPAPLVPFIKFSGWTREHGKHPVQPCTSAKSPS